MSTDHEQSWIKLAAVEEVKSLADLRSRSLDEHTHAFRWLTGSLLAINAGAAVAALNSDYLTANHKIIAGGFFGLGLLSALLIGVLAQKANSKYLPILNRQLGYWVGVADDGERLESMEADLAAETKRALRGAWAVPMVGWISALLFLAGIATMGLGLLDREQVLNNVETANQRSPQKLVAAQ